MSPTKYEIDHYTKLRGRTIDSVLFVETDGAGYRHRVVPLPMSDRSKFSG